MELDHPIPYPKGVALIYISIFFETFAYYWTKSLLLIYLINNLGYREDTARTIYSLFLLLYLSTIVIGAVIADSFLGLYRTNLYFSYVSAIGSVILALGAIPPLHLPAKSLSILGLILIGIGSGGIQSVVIAFGGNQFILPAQRQQLSTFFYIYYLIVYISGLISGIITPKFGKDVTCFQNNSCYSLVFGFPALFMVTSIAILVAGRPYYVLIKPHVNFRKVGGCVIHAIRNKRRGDTASNSREHFADYADDRYDLGLIADVKMFLWVLLILLPITVVWVLMNMKESGVNRHLREVDGGFIFVIIIPIVGLLVYPLLLKFNLLKNPLDRLITGGILMGVGFMLYGIVEVILSGATSVAWILTPYFLETLGLIMFTVGGMEYSFCQAPENMKSIVIALWMICGIVGNAIAAFIRFDNQPWKWFLVAGLIFMDILILGMLKYKSNRNGNNERNIRLGDASAQGCSTIESEL